MKKEKIYRIINEVRDTEQGAMVKMTLQCRSGRRWVDTDLRQCESPGTFAVYQKLCKSLCGSAVSEPEKWLYLAAVSIVPKVVKAFFKKKVTRFSYGALKESVLADPDKFFKVLDSETKKSDKDDPVRVAALKFIRQADDPGAWLAVLAKALERISFEQEEEENGQYNCKVEPDDGFRR